MIHLKKNLVPNHLQKASTRISLYKIGRSKENCDRERRSGRIFQKRRQKYAIRFILFTIQNTKENGLSPDFSTD